MYFKHVFTTFTVSVKNTVVRKRTSQQIFMEVLGYV